MNESDIESEIIAIINGHSVCRTTDVVNELLEKNKKTSKPTIYRKIAILKSQKRIAELNKVSFGFYGITTTDKRAKYLASSSYVEIKAHMDKILTYLKAQDKAIIISVLEEIKRYNDEYVLTPKQLDSLLTIPLKDDVIVMMVLSILDEYVFSKNIEPSNTKKFIRNLRTIVKTFKNSKDTPEIARIEKLSENFGLRERQDLRNVYFTALILLAHYGDDLVIERLKEDISDPERKEINPPFYYNNPRFAKIIDKNTTPLFDYQMKLRQEGDNTAAHDIGILRDMAKSVIKKQSFPLNYEENIKKKFGEGS